MLFRKGRLESEEEEISGLSLNCVAWQRLPTANIRLPLRGFSNSHRVLAAVKFYHSGLYKGNCIYANPKNLFSAEVTQVSGSSCL
jgi:hypothetical protein